MENKQREFQDRLDVDALVENLPLVTEFIENKVSNLNVSQMEMSQILIVAEELFVNIASYAYNPETGRASLITNVSPEENSIEITFIDSGIRYNPLEKEDPDITLDANKRKQGGLGIFFVKKKVDSMTYSYQDGKNIVTVKKLFKGNVNG